MLPKSLFILASAVTLVNSQFDPTSVTLATRQAWCNSQTSTCPLLCLQLRGASGSPTTNNCSAETLAYDCTCSNGISPNATEYSLTIPYYICTETNSQCVLNCDGNTTCQNNCRVDNPCGAQNPKRINVTTTTTTTTANTATATASETPVNTLVNGNGDTSATGAAPRMVSVDISHVYGLCVLVGGFVAGFAVLL
ncbi:hypothetical protein DTO012A7_8967 [Penicillium roqueforti]|uniref:uncharacterized protein n=1 Tax=Penicillium roqueforti TaxID=5082 RepID=UPI00190AD850|nr:uncharacterized protein LCP9604111_9465 [Penicillium roqueforti]KAF9238439.1 hypothetical protein LCP9604111_9465 [Penicillium roqueforti]KAI3103095.1 hypothetical protein CBS147333_7699 [Penicillium roqueforti]KAI3194624.1 hypothetical protein CBS147311_8529 [Penicillium roqueforti]KAI3222101.1 hypothetical protein DTO012A7_8967 [Penicillium roqueforti]KAI3263909.1 hypothetical protein CBS147308_8333 [Penicillium roqueforti]